MLSVTGKFKKGEHLHFSWDSDSGVNLTLAPHTALTQAGELWRIWQSHCGAQFCGSWVWYGHFFLRGGKNGKTELRSSCGGVNTQTGLTLFFFPSLAFSSPPTHCSHVITALGNGLRSSSWQLFAHFQQAKGKNTAGSFFFYFLFLVICSRFLSFSFLRFCVKEWITIAHADGRE